jgi:hypothetical protein
MGSSETASSFGQEVPSTNCDFQAGNSVSGIFIFPPRVPNTLRCDHATGLPARANMRDSNSFGGRLGTVAADRIGLQQPKRGRNDHISSIRC